MADGTWHMAGFAIGCLAIRHLPFAMTGF